MIERYVDFSNLGNYATVGSRSTVGDCATFGSFAKLGDYATVGNWAKLGDHAKLGNWVKLGDDATLGDYAKLGDNAKLGDDAKLGNGATLGDHATVGKLATLGNELKFGKRFTLAGVKVLALMCLSNVDGSGRQIKVIVHTNGVTIEAGCFSGTLHEFCERATEEGKTRYASVVRVAVEALQADVAEKGITGGWDEVAK